MALESIETQALEDIRVLHGLNPDNDKELLLLTLQMTFAISRKFPPPSVQARVANESKTTVR